MLAQIRPAELSAHANAVGPCKKQRQCRTYYPFRGKGKLVGRVLSVSQHGANPGAGVGWGRKNFTAAQKNRRFGRENTSLADKADLPTKDEGCPTDEKT